MATTPLPLLIYGTLFDIFVYQEVGAFENGTVEFALCGFGSQIPRIEGTAILARVTTKAIPVDEKGAFVANIYGNDLITPSGTFYTMTVKNDNGDVVQCNAYSLTGAGGISQDMSWAIPYDPNRAPPPLPSPVTNQLLSVDFDPTPEFDGTDYTTWYFPLVGDVTASTTTGLVPGNLYTFIIEQGGGGNNLFVWPPNSFNATLVNPQVNTTTIQTFVCDISGNLYAIAGGTYWP